MSDLVSSIRIPDLLDRLHQGVYQIPLFQRDFVWSTSDIEQFLLSIIDSRPVGMMTIWEQADDSGLELEHVSLPDIDPNGKPVVYYGDPLVRPNKFYAILDGRQRSTAIAMAFGGLSPQDKRKKYAGKFFLNVNAIEPSDRVTYISKRDIELKNLNTPGNCIQEGLIPFEFSTNSYESIDDQWMHYTSAVSISSNYKNSILPNENDLAKRIETIKSAFKGIINTTIAIYTVPKKYELGTICEIFETLNTTGTKVSTVDLIHSTLYADTQKLINTINLRDWLKEISQINGAIGWADPSDRPELIAQCVTSCYLVLEEQPSARNIGGKIKKIDSIKSGDLLATPTAHWQQIIEQQDLFIKYLEDFQKTTTNFCFPYRNCPYPVLSSIYIGLRWSDTFNRKNWELEKINSLYRAFFWRTAFSSRYDQGFLSKQFQDLKDLTRLLDEKKENHASWISHANNELNRIIGSDPISLQQLKKELLDHKPTGAIAKALHLAIRSHATKDLIDSSKFTTSFAANDVDLHHIFPKDWLRNNFQKQFIEDLSLNGKGGINCIANLTPMIRSSNLNWRSQNPGVALTRNGINFKNNRRILESHFINEKCFDILTNKDNNFEEFLDIRSTLIAETLYNLQLITD